MATWIVLYLQAYAFRQTDINDCVLLKPFAIMPCTKHGMESWPTIKMIAPALKTTIASIAKFVFTNCMLRIKLDLVLMAPITMAPIFNRRANAGRTSAIPMPRLRLGTSDPTLGELAKPRVWRICQLKPTVKSRLKGSKRTSPRIADGAFLTCIVNSFRFL